MKVTYDATYAIRGKSGIPRDAKSLISIFSKIQEVDLTILLFLKDYLPRFKWARSNKVIREKYLESILRVNFPLISSWKSIELILKIIESFNLNSKVHLLSLTDIEKNKLVNRLAVPESVVAKGKFNLALQNYVSRVIRPNFIKPFSIKNLDADVFIQQQVDPLTVNPKIAHVVRLHDVIPVTHPQFFNKVSARVFKSNLKLMAKHNPYFVTDTDFSASEIGRVLGGYDKIYVIPPIVSPELLPTYIKKKQILFVGTIEPRKRIDKLIEGFLYAKRHEMISREWQLIIAGGFGWKEEKLYKYLVEGNYGSQVRFIDSPEDTIIENLYNESEIIASLSAVEGFGLTPLEGLYFGCLPIVSKIESHLETLGDRGYYVEYFEAPEVAKVISTAVQKVEGLDREAKVKMTEFVQSTYGENQLIEKWRLVLMQILNHKKIQDQEKRI